MNRSETWLRRIAFKLARLASGLLPAQHAEWARAMSMEMHYLDRDVEALVWAIDCVKASITMRIESMIIGNLKISRWVLALELLLCFIPLTLVWIDSILGPSGIIRLSPEIIQLYFISSISGTIVLVTMFAAAILGIFGPLGLLIAFRLIVLGSKFPDKWLMRSLITGPVLLGAIYLTGWLIMGTTLRFDYWAAMILCSLLPAVGAAHIQHLHPAVPRSTAAA